MSHYLISNRLAVPPAWDALTLTIVMARARYHRRNGWLPLNAMRAAVDEQILIEDTTWGRDLIFPGFKVYTTAVKGPPYGRRS